MVVIWRYGYFIFGVWPSFGGMVILFWVIVRPGLGLGKHGYIVRAQACAVDLRDCVFNFMATFELIPFTSLFAEIVTSFATAEENKSLLFEASSQATLTNMQCSCHILTQIEDVGKIVDPQWPSVYVSVAANLS